MQSINIFENLIIILRTINTNFQTFKLLNTQNSVSLQFQSQSSLAGFSQELNFEDLPGIGNLYRTGVRIIMNKNTI